MCKLEIRGNTLRSVIEATFGEEDSLMYDRSMSCDVLSVSRSATCSNLVSLFCHLVFEATYIRQAMFRDVHELVC